MRINILILGKSGAGKSSLLNYLWGEAVAEAGVGMPVTPKSAKGETGLYENPPLVVGENALVIFDSWGLEADKALEWTRIIETESKKRESSDNVGEWFHAVIYCVSSSGARIEPFELNDVVKPLQKAGYSIIFALTKAGRASESERQGLRKVIEESSSKNDSIIEIEACSAVLRGGNRTDPMGRQETIEALTFGLDRRLKDKFAAQYAIKCKALCDEWKTEILDLYDEKATLVNSITGSFLDEIRRRAEHGLDEKLQNLESWRIGMERQIKSLQRTFSEVAGASNIVVSQRIRSPQPVKTIGLDGWETFASIVIHVIFPPYGFLTTKDANRKDLEGKLKRCVERVMSQVVNSAAPYGT